MIRELLSTIKYPIIDGEYIEQYIRLCELGKDPKRKRLWKEDAMRYGTFTKTELADRLSITRWMARRRIPHLLNDGRLIECGKRGSAKLYKLAI